MNSKSLGLTFSDEMADLIWILIMGTQMPIDLCGSRIDQFNSILDKLTIALPEEAKNELQKLRQI